jgi:hypothetical protein
MVDELVVSGVATLHRRRGRVARASVRVIVRRVVGGRVLVILRRVVGGRVLVEW